MSRRKEPSIPNEILDQLLAGTDAAAALSQGGLLDSLKKAFAERTLNAEMGHHLGHDDQVGNNRNGYGRKTVTTDSGRIEIEVPRDRAGSFDPQLIAIRTASARSVNSCGCSGRRSTRWEKRSNMAAIRWN
jgi:putative transposase